MKMNISVQELRSINIPQSKDLNITILESLGGVKGLLTKLNIRSDAGLNVDQVEESRKLFGSNILPKAQMTSFMDIFFEALSDSTLLILMISAVISLLIEMIEDPKRGWMNGTAILFTVLIISIVISCNNYVREIQFQALEDSSQNDELVTVIRGGKIELLNPMELVIGDIILLQVGDSVPADCVICNESKIKVCESSLTGESDDVEKSVTGDCFLLSSCLITDGESTKAVVIGIGAFSQWGMIKTNLVGNIEETPLQQKLGSMAEDIGKMGLAFALITLLILLGSIWASFTEGAIILRTIDAFILCIAIVVVAIPEGLPLAVLISLAYTTTAMYKENCLVRVLAACETMGNVTTICSDKTGTLTCNQMKVVEGIFGDKYFKQDDYANNLKEITHELKYLIIHNCCLNRLAHLTRQPTDAQDRIQTIGNKTECALILMAQQWGFNYNIVEAEHFKEALDKKFSFNSTRKRSSVLIHHADGSVRLFCKGAPEYIISDCTRFYSSVENNSLPMTDQKRQELSIMMNVMTERALRIICLAHKDYASTKDLPIDWRENPPDNSDLCCDCIVGIIDPLRDDVKAAVSTAQRAGIVIRMVTGDSISTACAIARDCGILTPGGIALEGSQFRNMTPRELDDCIHKVQVLARASPNDKFLLVTRLNGRALPQTREDWENYHRITNPTASWDIDAGRLLPGYKAEWEISTAWTGGREVVGVTGDGTNDAPALRAADVGLSMGITGTKVAQSASDIIIRDDKFSSIVTAILWGRSVYDNIRKFLQFQLTINVVVLALTLVVAVIGFEPPLNIIMMLWINLVQDTFGAIAFGTEKPSPELLNRYPYKQSASLISAPMLRNIICHSFFQFTLLLSLTLNKGLPAITNTIRNPNGWCIKYQSLNSDTKWDVKTGTIKVDGEITCDDFKTYCSSVGISQDCFQTLKHQFNDTGFSFSDLEDFEGHCLECLVRDYSKNTFIFNTFVFCQIFNEFNLRSLSSSWKDVANVGRNPMFLGIILVSIFLQVFIIEMGGDFTLTTPLSSIQWTYSILLASITILVGFLTRLIPIKEDPDCFKHIQHFSKPDDIEINSIYSPISSDSKRRHNPVYHIVSVAENELLH